MYKKNSVPALCRCGAAESEKLKRFSELSAEPASHCRIRRTARALARALCARQQGTFLDWITSNERADTLPQSGRRVASHGLIRGDPSGGYSDQISEVRSRNAAHH